MDEHKANFGCEQCWPSEAEAAWEARSSFKTIADLIDESHFHVLLLRCPSCTQPFVSIFTEMIDWTDGDDPQDWSVMPISELEANELCKQDESLNDAWLNELGHGRRSLRRDFPKGGSPRLYWSTGISVGMHD